MNENIQPYESEKINPTQVIEAERERLNEKNIWVYPYGTSADSDNSKDVDVCYFGSGTKNIDRNQEDEELNDKFIRDLDSVVLEELPDHLKVVVAFNLFEVIKNSNPDALDYLQKIVESSYGKYPNNEDLKLRLALQDNEATRLREFIRIPEDFYLKKYVFAKLQKEFYGNNKEFICDKDKLLERAKNEYENEKYDIIKRLLNHDTVAFDETKQFLPYPEYLDTRKFMGELEVWGVDGNIYITANLPEDKTIIDFIKMDDDEREKLNIKFDVLYVREGSCPDCSRGDLVEVKDVPYSDIIKTVNEKIKSPYINFSEGEKLIDSVKFSHILLDGKFATYDEEKGQEIGFGEGACIDYEKEHFIEL